MTELEQMMKCDMCYDRTSEGKRPMCAKRVANHKGLKVLLVQFGDF